MLQGMRRGVAELLGRRRLPRVVRTVGEESLTYLSESALHDLYRQVRRVEEAGMDGILVEAGCALGGSAIVIATAKERERPFFVYDTFGMIPPPSERDGADVHARYETIASGQSRGIGGHKYYGYEDDLRGKVTASFRRHHVPVEENNVHLVQGLFQETMHVTGPVALAHIDGDWFESVMTCLQRLEPHLVPGGVLVIDDYDDWSGCRDAVDEYFRDRRASYDFVHRSRLHIVRLTA
jgi:asparagine synthase (glutamine-hydrolysing)